VVEVDPPAQLEVSLLASSLLQVLLDTPVEAKKPAEPKKPVELSKPVEAKKGAGPGQTSPVKETAAGRADDQLRPSLPCPRV